MQENYQKQHSDESDKKEKGRRLDLLVDGKESYVFEVFFFFLLFSFENIIFQYTFPEKNFRKFHTFPKISFFKFNLVTTILPVSYTHLTLPTIYSV